MRVALLTRGSYFGEISLIKKSLRKASVRTITVCVVCTLTKAAFDLVAETYPHVRRDIEETSESRLQQNKMADKNASRENLLDEMAEPAADTTDEVTGDSSMYTALQVCLHVTVYVCVCVCVCVACALRPHRPSDSQLPSYTRC